jgi:hypothetical protein
VAPFAILLPAKTPIETFLMNWALFAAFAFPARFKVAAWGDIAPWFYLADLIGCLVDLKLSLVREIPLPPKISVSAYLLLLFRVIEFRLTAYG